MEWLGGFLRSPLELCPVGPDTVQDGGNLARNCDLSLFGADPLHQLSDWERKNSGRRQAAMRSFASGFSRPSNTAARTTAMR